MLRRKTQLSQLFGKTQKLLNLPWEEDTLPNALMSPIPFFYANCRTERNRAIKCRAHWQPRIWTLSVLATQLFNSVYLNCTFVCQYLSLNTCYLWRLVAELREWQSCLQRVCYLTERQDMYTNNFKGDKCQLCDLQYYKGSEKRKIVSFSRFSKKKKKMLLESQVIWSKRKSWKNLKE